MSTTMTAARLAEIVTALGEGHAPAAAEALAAARAGRLFCVDTGNSGEDGYTIADDAATALSDWLAVVYPDGPEAEGFESWDELVAARRWAAERVGLRHVRLAPDGSIQPPVCLTTRDALARIAVAVDRFRAVGATIAHRDDGGEPVACEGELEAPPDGVDRVWWATNPSPRLFEAPRASIALYGARATGHVYHADTGGPVTPNMCVSRLELARSEVVLAELSGDAARIRRAAEWVEREEFGAAFRAERPWLREEWERA